MKHNVFKRVALALAAVGLGLTARAEVSGGDIWSVDLVEFGGSVVPSAEHPLSIGEKVTVRLRMLNRGYDDKSTAKAWRFVGISGETAEKAALGPQLGLMFGGQQVFADFIGDEQVYVGTQKINKFTDLFFQYTVKSGDLALPARFMNVKGLGVLSDDEVTDYAVHYGNYLGGYWKLTNDNGDDCFGESKFHFCDLEPDPYPDPTYEAGEPHRWITGTGLGVYTKTIDFDTSYFEDPDLLAGTPGIWRKLYAGMTQSLPSVPAVKVDGVAAESATMYVWVDDPTVANVLSADKPELIDGRWVLKLPVPKGASSATFRLQGLKVGTTVVRMSSAERLSYNEAGDLIPDWVERPIVVEEPPDPSVLIEVLDPAGEALPKNTVTLSADYQQVSALIRLTLTQKPSADLTVTVEPSLDDGDIIADGLLGVAETTDGTPWEGEALSFTVGPNDLLTKTLYVYAKGTTAKMATSGVKFTVKTAGASEFDKESGKHSSNLVVKHMNPALVKPAKGDAITDAMAGKSYSLDITVSDARKHMVDAAVGDAAYTVYYKVEAPGTEGEWNYDDSVCLDDADTGEATVSVPFDIEGECNLLLYVLSPSGKKSPTTTIPVTVAAPKRATVTLDRENGVYAEGETAYVNFHLTQKYKSELYAFLVPQDDDEEKQKFETDISSETPGAIGYYIGPNETDTKIPTEVRVLDGKAIGHFQVFMCTTKNYSKTKSAGYIGDVFTVSATNVVPVINRVSMGGQDIDASGATTKTVAQNVEKTFRITDLAEPGVLDLEATGDDAFLTQWKFGTGDWQDMPGNPNLAATSIKHTFTSPGDQVVKVRCQDKDMRKLGKWSDEFVFTVPVLDIPKVVITPKMETRQYYEDQTGSDYGFNVSLTAAPDIADGSQRLTVEIRRELIGDPSKYSVDDLILSRDTVTFSGGTSSGADFFLKQLDGTAESAGSGFRLVAHVVNPEIDVEGKNWDDGELEIYILNRPPSIKSPTQALDAEGNPIATATTIGAENKLAWVLRDVVADKQAMRVTWATSEGETVEYTQGDPGWDDVMTGTHTFKFSSAGEKSITLTATDKDGDSESRTFYYTITPSKTLIAVAQGPAGGYNTMNSMRYRSASGLGQGRVWAKNLSSVEGFKSLFNCGTSGSWDVYGYGYKVGDVDDGANLHKVDGSLGYYVKRDTPIDENGDALAAGGTAYAYAAATDKNGESVDSFLYTWLSVGSKKSSAESGGNSSMTDEIFGKAIAPEFTELTDSGAAVILPEKSEGKDDTYQDTILQAVFAREYLATDNMGDINQDAIPDIYVTKYGLGVIDADSHELAGDDLKAITAANNGNLDEDYLPLTGAGHLSALIPGLPDSWSAGTPFAAKLEIRGYGEGLNDAPAKAGVTGVKPERRYTDPRTDPRSTLDGLDVNGGDEPVEYLAWLDFAAVNGLNPADPANWERWSPECPTDPMVADTDDDGFTDGYEYFFWYRAHVGYMDGGLHRYLTGRAYDPRNPGEGRLISSATIEQLMNPVRASGDASASALRDSDNDGLPDKIEFLLGTNPFDFDSDGDGLPDGYEVMVGTDPLAVATVSGVHDATRNYDGDAMAFTTPKLAKDESVRIPEFCSFALVDAAGDTDGVQWYVTTAAPTNLVQLPGAASATLFALASDTNALYLTTTPLAVVDGVLAGDAPKQTTFRAERVEALTNALPALVELVGSFDAVALMPTTLLAGTAITNATAASYLQLALATTVENANAAWPYGRAGVAGEDDFGMLAVARPLAAPAKVPLAALPTPAPDAALLHYLVYQQCGFDPRTAWRTKSATAMSRAYTLYDEFLVMSFFLNNGMLGAGEVTPTTSRTWQDIWGRYTTNGQGPDEPAWDSSLASDYRGRTAEGGSAGIGADTDGDGVADGWELYVMSGPKALGGQFVFVGPDAPLSPWVASAGDQEKTDKKLDGDKLTELQEFEGTDVCKYYAEGDHPYSSTIATRATRDNPQWINKYWPTDPWNSDTDGDELSDGVEANNVSKGGFIYGTPVDCKVPYCVPGGGLNPCSMDTDMDGLPDAWESRYHGLKIYDGADAQITEDDAGNQGNPLQGLCDGMDGTVFDAYNSPRVLTSVETNSTKELVVILNGVAQVVDRDYDHDGLANWQEYLTGAMRCWRYDDTVSPWSYVAESTYFDEEGNFNLTNAAAATGCESQEEFLYKTFICTTNELYNPYLVTETASGAQYFTRCANLWDQAYGRQYLLPTTRDGQPFGALWGYEEAVLVDYVGTSPIMADTDGDGMDDGYELFHGMNPLLGDAKAIGPVGTPRDVIAAAWVKFPYSSEFNYWNPVGLYDFDRYPWLNGLASADPDGDDIRNQDEAIMPGVAPSATWYHTDPTPLWMTDSSYSNSLVRKYFRLPMSVHEKIALPETFEYPAGVTNSLLGVPSYVGGEIVNFAPDYWQLTSLGAMNWLYSFEENEGYDTDHDFGSDYEELQGKYRAKTDPQDADSPRRRQAMYFAGPAQPSALQTMPFVGENYPVATETWPDDMAFLQYTVECWVRPESKADATVVERAVFTGDSHLGDEQFLRCNFRLGIRNGRWYTMFDPNGTLAASQVEVESEEEIALDKWTYLAATYDADRLVLYVNGEIVASVKSSLKPAYGSYAVVTYPAKNAGASTTLSNDVTWTEGSLTAFAGQSHAYWSNRAYEDHAFLIGASFKNEKDLGYATPLALNVLWGSGWSFYHNFYTGYIDEVRVWDGAQSADTIAENYRSRKRYTREDALANRDAFYNQWKYGQRRYAKDGNGTDYSVVPELRYHWSFDSVAGAENPAAVATAPHGFADGAKTAIGCPVDYVVGWWKQVLDGYGSVYAGQTNWVTWVPNTVTHLPRFDGSTLDSMYWVEGLAGVEANAYRFARTAEPVSLWTQYTRNGTMSSAEFFTTDRRFWQTHVTGTNAVTESSVEFLFNGRHLNQLGDDLLPLGGAFVKYVDKLWDDEGASSMWETTGEDADNDGLPDWWQEYANQNYREGLDDATEISWSTPIWYEIAGTKQQIPAYQAYLRDLAKGKYVDANGIVSEGPTVYAQTAKSDTLIPDWWKSLYKIDQEGPLADTDYDGLDNYGEYYVSERLPFQLMLDPTNPKTSGGVLDYFRKPFDGASKLYVGEMLTDHDQMADNWERRIGDDTFASAAKWDALRDARQVGWDNFSRNRTEDAFGSRGESSTVVSNVMSKSFTNAQMAEGKAFEAKMRESGLLIDVEVWGSYATSTEALNSMVSRVVAYYEVVTNHSSAVIPEPTFTLTVTFDRHLLPVGASNVAMTVEASADGLGVDAQWKTSIRDTDVSQGSATVTLGKPDVGYVRQGENTFTAYLSDSAWEPGIMFGVTPGVDVGWAGTAVKVAMTEMSAITPRVDLWEDASDRGERVGAATWTDGSNRFEAAKAPAPKSHVHVVRYQIDGWPVYKLGVDATIVLDKNFTQEARPFLHEGDFLADGDLDIDWNGLYDEVVSWSGVLRGGCDVTNVAYLAVFDWDAEEYASDTDQTVVKALPTLITRRFERARTVPTAHPERAVFNRARPTFTWSIDNEDAWASFYGTTYTGFKVLVKDLDGKLVYDSGIRRLPAKDADGLYRWTAALSVGDVVPGTGVTFENLANYTWEVAVYNAKFRTDTLMGIDNNRLVTGNPFSAPEQFRMNVTTADASSECLAARVCYVGPAKNLAGKIRMQAFVSPDFTGDPEAECVLADVGSAALSPASAEANAKLTGLAHGKYYLRAYIDTNGNGVHDDWESWGYVSARDYASKPAIFNPESVETAFEPATDGVRKLFIEDCDTDGDCFPDVWEAEQNGNVFDRAKIAPVTGSAELIRVNPMLERELNAGEFPFLNTLASKNGFALLTGVRPSQVKTTVAANGASRLAVDNQVDSVRISALEFDADGNVVIRIDAKTSTAAVDGAIGEIYDIDLSKTVTCRIYRTSDLKSGWGDPVAVKTVTVGAGPVTVELGGEKAEQAFYKAEIAE